MEQIKKGNYKEPKIKTRTISSSLICASIANIGVGGPTDQPFDARQRSTTKESKVSSID